MRETSPRETASIVLQYRRLNQAERYRSLEMQRDGAAWRAAVPAEYTASAYPLQYYFEVRSGTALTLWPGFKDDFLGQPYLVVQQPGG